MDLFRLSLLIFLGIFVATAIIAIGSLPGWIRIPEKYRRTLFRLLILEVIACIVGFVVKGINAREATSIDSTTLSMLLAVNGWDWQYVEEGWRTQGRFFQENGHLRFSATTFLISPKGGETVPIVEWASDDIELHDSGDGQIEFHAIQTWLQGALMHYPEKKDLIGQSVPIVVRLRSNVSLRGSWQPANGLGAIAGMNFVRRAE